MSAIHQALNDLIRERIRTQDRQPVTEEEIKAIRDAVEPRVKSAIKSNLTFGQKLFGNQDDVLGFAHVAFIGEEIQSQDFVFPELVEEGSRNRFELSGSLTVGPVPPDPVDPCASLRAAVQAKRDEVKGLHSLKAVLQQQLQTALPQAKPALILQITQTSTKISQAEAELRQREVVLQICEGGVLDPAGATGGVGDARVASPEAPG